MYDRSMSNLIELIIEIVLTFFILFILFKTYKGKRKLLLLLLVLIIASAGGFIFLYLIRTYTLSQICMTVQNIQNDGRCLYILDNKVFEKGDRVRPHKCTPGQDPNADPNDNCHPCGSDVSNVIPESHRNNPLAYLDPNFRASVCPPPSPTPTMTPTLTPTMTPTLTLTPTPTATRTPTPSPIITSTRTPTPTPTRTLTSSPSPTPILTATRTPTPTITLTPSPSPTRAPTAARLRFRIKLPDISIAINNISASDVQIQLRDGLSTVGVANGGLLRSGLYFMTISGSEPAFNILQNKAYSVGIKTKTSLRKIFSSVVLSQYQILDCSVIINLSCGELITQRDNKLLFSGDSDGFNTSSGSYNKIDSADLYVLASQFNTQAPSSGPSADFNLDGQVNINDLDILGRNYGLQGD